MSKQSLQFKVSKTSDDPIYHYAEGVVYAPNELDSDAQYMGAEDIQKMAHDFIASGHVLQIDTNHDNYLNGCEVVESFIARKDDPDYPENAWVMKIRMTEDSPVWEAIKRGELNGYSVEMYVNILPETVLVDMVKLEIGETEVNGTDDLPDHTHEFYVEFNEKGRIIFGKTSEEHGHSHIIFTTTATEMEADHAHRWFCGVE